MRNERSLIQTIGRAARNEHGHVIMYADEVTASMRTAIDETKRRRTLQQQYNQEHHITPHTIKKKISAAISVTSGTPENADEPENEVEFSKMSRAEQHELINNLEQQMQRAAKELNYEEAATLRDTIMELKLQIGE